MLMAYTLREKTGPLLILLAVGWLCVACPEEQPPDEGPVDFGTPNLRDVSTGADLIPDTGADDDAGDDTSSDVEADQIGTDQAEDQTTGDDPGETPRDTGGGGSDRTTEPREDPDPVELPIICEPNAGRCVTDVAILCNETGTDETYTDCIDDQICFGGECLEPFCEPNSVTCVGNVVERCDSLGLSVSAVPCGEDVCIGSECVPRVCQPGLGVCDKDTGAATICDALGLTLTESTCDPVDHCEAGFCLSEACAPGRSFCVEDTLVTCDFDEFEEPAATSCYSLGLVCEDLESFSTCSIRYCTPDEVRCSTDAESLVYCDGTGRDRTEYDCPEEHACSEGACQRGRCTDYWPDVDGDEYGDRDVDPVCTIAPPTSTHQWVSNGLDCDDGNNTVHEGCGE